MARAGWPAAQATSQPGVSTLMNSELVNFENARLNEMVAAFKKRSKAIKHQSCDIEFSREEDEDHERLNIDCDQLASPTIQIRISIWDDGAMYFRTCQGSKNGWIFNIQFYGVAFDIDSEKLVSNFESGLNLTGEEELMQLWKDISPYKQWVLTSKSSRSSKASFHSAFSVG